MKNKIILLTALTVILMSLIFISKKEDRKQDPLSHQQTQSKARLDLQTNASAYAPGEQITLMGMLSDPRISGEFKAEVFHLGRKIHTETFSVENGRFKHKLHMPEKDFKGYLLKVSLIENPKVSCTIAVDISSDWSRFPRYGFLSEFGDKTEDEIKDVLTDLNRFHLNGLQFYDYHYKHHQPLKMNGEQPVAEWEDIANRPTSFKTIQQYIVIAHQFGMKTMAYNLLYGTFENAEEDGVKPEWYLYRDKKRGTIDSHPLPENWKSNVLLTNTTHPEWQDYIINQQNEVYKHLNFDGWHIDQLGKRNEVFNEHGDQIHLDQSFGAFLQKIKYSNQSKRLVMNAVNQYGQQEIGKSPVDFLYTEVWDEYKHYSDLKKIIDENRAYSNGTKNTVLAAYMNYNRSNYEGNFNESSILLANSVIFAAGGSHLELGEHMLSKEYFPHHKLDMSHKLKTQLISYYDFLVAYQNLLRDVDVNDSEMEIQTPADIPVSSSAEQGKIWTISKQKDNLRMLHLINFTDSSTMEWRDTEATQPIPIEKKYLEMVVKADRKPKKVWFASPDVKGGLPQELTFNYKDGTVSFNLPSLKYWDMVVFED